MNEKIASFIDHCIASHIFPGCVIGIIDENHEEIAAAGNFTYEASSPTVTPSTIYDVASITKAIPTACCALSLIEKGKMSLSTRIVDIIPEVSGPYRESITVWNLLTHTLEFDFRLSDKKTLPPQALLQAIYSAPLHKPPGTSFFYANATSIILGLVVERVAMKRLDELAHEFFFDPLGMTSTSFFPEKLSHDRIAPTEIDPWRGREIRGEVHDESAWALHPLVTAGSAGLFSTAEDLLIFLKMLLLGGEYSGKRYFDPQTIRSMHTNALPSSLGASAALGWELNSSNYMGRNRTETTFGKTGFTGCTMIADPVRRTGFVLLTNHIYPHRKADRKEINGVRATLADLVFSKTS